MHRKVAVALVAALALGIAGCGGSEETLTKGQIVSRVEAACKKAQQVAEQRSRTSGSGSMAFITAILAGQQALVDAIDGINPSDATKDDFDAFKQGMQDRADLFARVKDSGAAGIRRAMQDAQAEGEAMNKRIHAAASRLGVTSCG